MKRDIKSLRARKEVLAKRLETTLAKFKKAKLIVAHSITKNQDGDMDFAFTLQYLGKKPKNADGLVQFAKEKIFEWEPESKPDIRLSPPALAL